MNERAGLTVEAFAIQPVPGKLALGHLCADAAAATRLAASYALFNKGIVPPIVAVRIEIVPDGQVPRG